MEQSRSNRATVLLLGQSKVASWPPYASRRQSMKAYHGKQSVKDFYINRMKAHMEGDELIRGTYWDEESHSGCAVGCLLERSEDVHAQFEPELGIPPQLAVLEDHLF